MFNPLQDATHHESFAAQHDITRFCDQPNATLLIIANEVTAYGPAYMVLPLEEAKEINQSLGALKECIRIQLLNSRVPPGGKLAHVPIRTSKLTTLLKDCFEGAAMSFIAHVAPLRSTARHTVSTLEYSAAMLQATRAQRERTGFADVERWSAKKLGVR